MLESIQYFSFLIFIGTIPSLIWLSYYIKKDPHKEPKGMIMQVFLLGGISTIIALFLEAGYLKGLHALGLECQNCDEVIPDYLGVVNFLTLNIGSFIALFGLAYIEELLKYLAVKIRIIKDKAFDEPVDAMIYLIAGALGFAAVENIGYILTADPEKIFALLIMRFFTATFLHALASAIVGYFFALSIIHKKNHLYFISLGIIFATIFHALFNLLITLVETWQSAPLYLALLLLIMWQTVRYMFKRIKKIHYNMQQENNI